MILSPLQKYKKDLHEAIRDANVTNWFERYLNKSRGLGNTDMLIYACQQKGATLITHTTTFAEEIAEQHKIKAVVAGKSTWAVNPSRSVVDNAAIMALVKENMRIQMLAEQLLQLMNQKGID